MSDIQAKIAALPPKRVDLEWNMPDDEKVEYYRDNYLRAEAERDLALEVLREMVAVYSGQLQNDGCYTVLDDQARAVLAACGGESRE
jgi:hypothetical protein